MEETSFNKDSVGLECFNRGTKYRRNYFTSTFFFCVAGLTTIHELTKSGDYELRADMEDFENQKRYASYG